MTFDVKVHPSVDKFLKKCHPTVQEHIRKRLRLLKDDPFRYLEHYEGRNYYKFRIGHYRALIDVDHTRRIVWVRVLDHRERIYERP